MRIAVLSDIHANLPALEAVLVALGPVDAVWQLGDAIGYGPQPNEVVERLRGLDAVGVQGNHEAAALGRMDLAWFNDDARAAIEWTAPRLTAESRDWLAALPDRRVERGVTLVHGSPRDPLREYVLSPAIARASLAAATTPHVLFGHTHDPRLFREVDGRVESLVPAAGATLALDERPALANPGSVGQPRDGDPRASALELDTENGGLRWLRIAYPIATTQARMREAGLPRRLIDRLDLGL
jgi:diadenosine tetraphosphatase ApaH/serine/threonine PP2A family protein phosphatase